MKGFKLLNATASIKFRFISNSFINKRLLSSNKTVDSSNLKEDIELLNSYEGLLPRLKQVAFLDEKDLVYIEKLSTLYSDFGIFTNAYLTHLLFASKIY